MCIYILILGLDVNGSSSCYLVAVEKPYLLVPDAYDRADA